MWRHEFGLLSRIVSRRKLQFLGFFRCREIPRILFERVCQPSKAWNEEGEIVSESCDTIIGLDSDIKNIIQEAELHGIICVFNTLWNQIYVIDEGWSELLSTNVEDIDRRNIQFNILELVMKAYPTPHTEISWMEIEEQLWEVVRTTCVPFLGIIDINDVMDYLDGRNFDRIKKMQYINTLAKFLLRISRRVGRRTATTFDSLISSCYEYLEEWPGVKSLYLARAINDQKIENLNHHDMKYLNGVIGLGLASTVTNEMSSNSPKNRHQINWRPLETPSAPSTIEILAQAELYGAASLAKIPGVIYENLTLTARVLIAFSEVKLKSFATARDLLVHALTELKNTYGHYSMEAFLVGTTLVNCLNRCGQEAQAEDLAKSICEKVVGQLDTVTTAQNLTDKLSIVHSHYTNSDMAMVIGFADCLLGQGKYDIAISLCQAVLKRIPPGCENMAMSAALRVSKMARRLGTEDSSVGVQNDKNIDAWKVLRDISKVFSTVSSPLKYAYIEEVICHLSLLKPTDTRQRIAASEVIKVLPREPPIYEGPASSRRNFLENFQTIDQYREQLKNVSAD
ncbi:hypothetical protein NHQ30_003242 [Ciborinia camelliae]|nr:hypothetical protein NHQ30_003242 [Ciborinia camelliae]